MRIRSNQDGFSAVEIVLVVVIVAILGFVGYTVYQRQAAKTASSSSPSSSQTASNPAAKANDVATAPAISSASDLDKATAVLDQTHPSGSSSTDSSQLDSQLSTF